MRTVLITGGFGFIGANLVRFWRDLHEADRIVVVDSCTYAARPDAVADCKVIEERIDIREQAALARVMQKHRPDICFNLAAESHVCRSIAGPKDFITTNVVGAFNVFEEWRALHDCDGSKPIIHVSTDEVFGELEPDEPPFDEGTPLAPRSPYAASKASSDMIAMAYFETYGLPVRITNCSNNFGPLQHEEKLIPATIKRIMRGEPVRLYGDGRQVRDWIFVTDHCRALATIAQYGESGERYCIGGDNERTNEQITRDIHDICVRKGLIDDRVFHVEHFAQARPTDDRRYAVDSSKVKGLGWRPLRDRFEEHLADTISWYFKKELQ